MLKYGDRVLNRKNEDGEKYSVTVIEEILALFAEDGYEMQLKLNDRIISEIKEGLQQNELRSGSFFFGLMDEEMVGKVATALIDPHQHSDWEKHNIFFSTEEDVLPKIVSDTMIRHKREFVMQMISEIMEDLKTDADHSENYQKILKLNELRKEMDTELYRIL